MHHGCMVMSWRDYGLLAIRTTWTYIFESMLVYPTLQVNLSALSTDGVSSWVIDLVVGSLGHTYNKYLGVPLQPSTYIYIYMIRRIQGWCDRYAGDTSIGKDRDQIIDSVLCWEGCLIYRLALTNCRIWNRVLFGPLHVFEDLYLIIRYPLGLSRSFGNESPTLDLQPWTLCHFQPCREYAFKNASWLSSRWSSDLLVSRVLEVDCTNFSLTANGENISW